MPADVTSRSKPRLFLAMLAATFIAACGGQEQQEYASLVVTDARIWTGDQEMPWAEAIASQGETILAVGSVDDIAPFIGEGTEVISIPGSMLVPGFIDTHVHFIFGGNGLTSVQLRDAATPEEFTRRIAEFAGGIESGEYR